MVLTGKKSDVLLQYARFIKLLYQPQALYHAL